MQKTILWIEVIGVVIASLLAIIFAGSFLAKFDLQIMAIFFIFYFFFRKFILRSRALYVLEVLVFVFVVVSTVLSTGGLQSPFFFLLYFLLFALSLLFEPITTLVLTLVLLVYFFAFGDHTLKLSSLLPLFSLPFVVPFAKYMGDLQQKSNRQKQELKNLVKAKQKLEKTKTFEQEQSLIFLTVVFYQHIYDIKERLNNFLGDEDLNYLKGKVKHLETLGQEFKKFMEKI
jgi:hypothetical protein